MLRTIVRYLKGYLHVELRGNSPERFINLCRHHRIYVWKLYINENICTFCILTKDYRQLLPVAYKTKTYPHILKRVGMPFILSMLFKMRSLLPALAVFGIILYVLSLFIWDISISGQCRHTSEELIEYLEIEQYKVGMFRSRVDGNLIEKKIRNYFNDISWVSVELSGCNIHIKIIESDTMEDMTTTNNTSSDIIASSDGTISSIITRSGIPKVIVGDEVKQGDVLVSGVVPLYDDGGNVIDSKLVYADADIMLNTTYSYKDIFSSIHEVKQYSGREKIDYSLLFNNKLFFLENLLNEFESYENYDIINQCADIKLLDRIPIGVSIIKNTYKEYEIVFETYNNEEAVYIARKHLNRYINDLINSGVSVYDNKVVLTINNGICTADGLIYVTEPQLMRQEAVLEDGSVKTSDGDDGTVN